MRIEEYVSGIEKYKPDDGLYLEPIELIDGFPFAEKVTRCSGRRSLLSKLIFVSTS
jgi:hypothetical protein